MSIIFIIILLFVLEFVYFKLADKYNIIDKPNERSSHKVVTIRGGGIIFPVAVCLAYLFIGSVDIYFLIGLLAISFISFLDDIYTLNNKLRLLVHLTSVALLCTQWQLFSLSWYWLILAIIFVIATINAYNFMDGVNGITVGYSLVTMLTLFYINRYIINFVPEDFLLITAAGFFVFGFFNFRNRAKCFAGDVGSVSAAFIIVYLIGTLIIKTENLAYILLLLVYGVDTAITVFFRKIRKENIFEAHRSHFYQYLSNGLKISHIKVSSIYMVVQLLVNILLISFLNKNLIYLSALFILVILTYLTLRFKLEGKNVLLKHYNI